jgi:hypothetical protein
MAGRSAVFHIKVRFGATVALVAAVLGWSAAADEVSTTRAAAGEQADDVAASPDSLVTREAWKQRIEQARARAEQARRDWRLNAPLRPFTPDPPEKIATERALSDDTLQPGDIVSTTNGFLLFRGRSGVDGQAADFVPIVPR